MAFTITDEVKNQILQKSAMALGNNPSEDGLSATQIKKHFYTYLNDLIAEINTCLLTLKSFLDENSVAGQVSAHNGSAQAHTDLRTAISSYYSSLNTAKVDKVEGKGLSKNDFSDAYKQKIDTCVADLAEKFGQDDFTFSRSADGLHYELGVGEQTFEMDIPKDRFVKSVSFNQANNTLDFVFETTNGEQSTSVSLAQLCNIYQNGTGILLNNNVFSADQSVLATKSDLDGYVTSATFSAQMAQKQNAMNEVSVSESSVTVQDDTVYSCGLQTVLTILLPQSVGSSFEAFLSFRSGAVATTLSVPTTLLLSGDDCQNGVLTPISNRLYEIHIRKVDGVLLGLCQGTDYEVI